MKWYMITLIVIFVLLTGIIPISAKTGQENLVIIGFEGKIGSKAGHNALPIGFGGNIDFKLFGENARWGFDVGIDVLSSWEDSLDIMTSPEPSDTAKYDVWIQRGTDISFLAGTILSYRLLNIDKFVFSLALGGGFVANISGYDDIKKSTTGPATDQSSYSETEFEGYIKPRAKIQINKFYLGYEYYAIANSLEHTLFIGVTF
ncbi:hypothetical protein DRQ36_00425 [bacterium]|nr:MAG: hypothetical protein DRQ36_00425 [bacterium]